jgi:2-dehydro-3-deoxyphosphogluconate aldolase/(4S)-4-hydroxy-2-oxoglutarate aldolase
MDSMDIVRKERVFAVIRAGDAKRALLFAEACIQGGLRLIEITFSFSGAERVISELCKRGDAFIGAGTVLNLDMARAAVDSGARFIISPHTDGEIISYAKSRGVIVVSGALTSNEILTAWNLGADMVKVFPIKAVGGAPYIRAIKEPLPFVEVMTTGGVTLENLMEFLSAGATAVGLSSALTGVSFDSEAIRQRARRVVQILGEA